MRVLCLHVTQLSPHWKLAEDKFADTNDLFFMSIQKSFISMISTYGMTSSGISINFSCTKGNHPVPLERPRALDPKSAIFIQSVRNQEN